MWLPSGVVGGSSHDSSWEGFGGAAQEEKRPIMLEKIAFGENVVQSLYLLQLCRVLGVVLVVVDARIY